MYKYLLKIRVLYRQKPNAIFPLNSKTNTPEEMTIYEWKLVLFFEGGMDKMNINK